MSDERTAGYSRFDLEQTPPRVTVPRLYNAAVDLVERNLSEGRGENIAVIDDQGRYSYRELAGRVDRCGNALLALGLQAEQRCR